MSRGHEDEQVDGTCGNPSETVMDMKAGKRIFSEKVFSVCRIYFMRHILIGSKVDRFNMAMLCLVGTYLTKKDLMRADTSLGRMSGDGSSDEFGTYRSFGEKLFLPVFIFHVVY